MAWTILYSLLVGVVAFAIVFGLFMFNDDDPGFAAGFGTAVGGIIAVCAFCGFMGAREYQVRQQCLELGYPTTRTNFTVSKVWCVARINQSDVVVPLEQAKRR